MKALGTGIGFEVSRLDFDTAGKDLSTNHITRSTTLEVDGAPAPEWQFEETMLEDHCVAVATRPDKPEQVSGMRDCVKRKKKTTTKQQRQKQTTTTKNCKKTREKKKEEEAVTHAWVSGPR